MMNIKKYIEKISSLNNENYDSLIELHMLDQSSKDATEKKFEGLLQSSGFYDINNFLNETLQITHILISEKKLKNTYKFLKAICSIKEYSLILTEKHSDVLLQINKNIQNLETDRINKSFSFMSKKEILNINFYYLINNLHKLKNNRKTPIIKFISKNINYLETDNNINNNKNTSFFQIVLDEVKDENKAKEIIIDFYNNINVDKKNLKQILENELMINIHKVFEFLPTVYLTKNKIFESSFFLTEHNFNYEDIDKILSIFDFQKKDYSCKNQIHFVNYLNKKINTNNFYNIIKKLNKNTIINISSDLTFLLNNINIDFLQEQKNIIYINTDFISPITLKKKFLDTSILFNIKKITPKELCNYLEKVLNIYIKHNLGDFFSLKNNKKIFLKFMDKDKKPFEYFQHQDENKVVDLIKAFDDDFTVDIIQNTFNKKMKLYFNPVLVINEIIESAFKNNQNVNSVFHFIKNNIKDENKQEQIFFLYLSRNILTNEVLLSNIDNIKHFFKNIDNELEEKILDFLKNKNFFDYQDNVFIKYSNIKKINENKTRLIFENVILKNQFDIDFKYKNKKRL